MRELYPDNAFVAPKIGTGTRLVIAEAPGEEESIKGEPLVGGAGRVFDMWLSKVGISRETLTLVNCINCRPPNNVFPTDGDARSYISKDDADKAVAHCKKSHVLPILQGRKWTRVDLLGEKPLRLIAGKREGIKKWRGSPLAITELGNHPVAIPTLHPAFIMRDQSMIPVVLNDLAKSLITPPEDYNITPSVADVKAFTATEFAFDIETGWPVHERITMVGLCDRVGHAMTVPFHGEYITQLKRIFNAAKHLVGHNCIQFDLPRLAAEGVVANPEAAVWDTMLLQHLRFPDLPHDLEFTGSQFSNKPAWKADRKNTGTELYCARDTDVTWQCYRVLRPLIAQNSLLELYQSVAVPLASICLGMQKIGFKVDTSRIKYVREKLLKDMAAEELNLPPEMRTQEVSVKKREPAPPGTLSPKTGKPLKFVSVETTKRVIPWRSSAQKQVFLYGQSAPWQLHLNAQTDVKTGNITTGKTALDKLYRQTKNRSILALHKLNQMDELETTFCSTEMVAVHRMHPHFNVHGTASGRLSSSDPNLQNIPETARYIYVPSNNDWSLVDIDYSQIENRLTAYFAGDHDRMGRFINDPDFSEHRYAASIFLNVPYDEVAKEKANDSPYMKAKRIVHGTNYGMGSKKISLMYDLDFKEVKRLQDLWKNEIRETIRWQERTGEKAKKDGYLTTPFGRKRWFYTSSYFTESLSFLPQSTAADIIFRSMIALMHERISWPLEKVSKIVQVAEPLLSNARLLLQVHDSLVFECPTPLVPELVAQVRRVMEQPWPELGGLSIPVGVAVGPSWGECEKYTAH
jgi:uracil-DNA glycosylase family 4